MRYTNAPINARIVCFTSEKVRMPSSGFRREAFVDTASKQLQERQFFCAQPDGVQVQHLHERDQQQQKPEYGGDDRKTAVIYVLAR